jgi:hypothetical protein
MLIHALYVMIAGSVAVNTVQAEPEQSNAFVLEIEASNPQGGFFEVFFDTGRGYNQFDWVGQELPASEELTSLRFVLARGPIKRIRIDPAQNETVMRIGKIRLLTPAGETLAAWGPGDLAAMRQIESIRIQDGLAIVTTSPGSNDPMIYLRNPPHEKTTRWLGRKNIDVPQVILLATLIGAMIGIAWCGAYSVMTSGYPSWKTRKNGLAVASVFIFVLGFRLTLLYRFSSPIPYWDEWEADLYYLVLPFLSGYLDWPALFELHSEHRIVVTRLITLVGVLLNGEYDPRIGMVAGAVLWSATIALVSAGIFRLLPKLWFSILIPYWVIAALPFDSTNLTWGGQSQIYALTFMATCTLALGVATRPNGFLFLAAAGASGVSLLTMGSGFVAPLIAVGLCLYRSIGGKEFRRIQFGYASVFAVAALVGLLTYEKSSLHASSYAKTAIEFWHGFQGFASWPLPPGPGALLIMWLPWFILGVVLLARPDRSRRASSGWLAFGLGTWTLVHAAGLGYSRPGLSTSLDPKYLTSEFAIISATVAATAYLCQRPLRPYPKILIVLLTIVSCFAAWMAGMHGIDSARAHLKRQSIHTEIVASYLRTRNHQLLFDLPAYKTPYWNSNELAVRLESADLIGVLPFELRAGSQVLNSSNAEKADSPGRLTLLVVALMKCSRVLAGLGAFLFLISLFLPRQTGRKKAAPTPLQ